ncbi:hypothetical protein KAU88_10145 [Candidatus Bathyarchaeota archaeon]|nr:hypothetical protein [Candidatus Bathyarchaeota archaeon]
MFKTLTPSYKPSEFEVKRIPDKTTLFMKFDVEREDWNLYELEDSTILRAKFVLTSVWFNTKLQELAKKIKKGQRPDPGLGFRARNLFAVEPLARFRGQPDSKAYSPKELEQFVEKKDMDFETLKETWNVYKMENGVIMKVRMSPISVNRTAKFDNGGLRIYSVHADADVKVEFPKFIEKLLARKNKA